MKLGTDKRPAAVHVQTMERAQEVLRLCEERGWKVIVGIEPDQPEEMTDIEKLLNPTGTSTRKEPSVGRNDPCLCGSGKKFKRCCIGKEQSS